MINPKICIVFNSGAAGDFFVWLLSQQVKQLDKTLELESTGAVMHALGESFKTAAEKFYTTNFDISVFDDILDEPIVSTHYCYLELLELFPNCQFYFIDDTDYINVTIEMYIKKRVPNLKEWLHERPKVPDIKKIQHISDNHIKTIMKNDWQKHLALWKTLNIQSINLYDILHKDNCLLTIKSLLNANVNIEKFSDSHNSWAMNNKDFINKVLNERL
jgi:hypothetical protein